MLIPLLLLLAADPALHQWSNLERLAPSERLEVMDSKMKSYRGTLASWNDTHLNLTTSRGPVQFERQQVFRVSLLGQSHRVRNTLIGAAIGGGAGLAIGAMADKRFSNEGREHIGKTLFAPIGLGVGAGLGAAMPAFETVYRAQPRP